MCEDALEQYERWEDFENELNSKSIQTMVETHSIAVQAEHSTRGQAIQCDILMQENEATKNFLTTPIDDEIASDYENVIESTNENDSSFSEKSDDGKENQMENQNRTNVGFIVFWSSLVTLLERCFTCFGKTKLVQKVRGSLLIVTMCCINGHEHIWRSQPLVNKFAYGNIKLCSAVLFSAGTFAKISKYFSWLVSIG